MSRAVFRFYAELNDFLPPGRRARDLEFEFAVPGPVKDAIESFGVPHTEVELVVVNGESRGFDQTLADGDRVAVYPVFEALDIKPLVRVRAGPLRETRFVLDVHLGRLARYLRMLGFDSLYSPAANDNELAACSAAERRILLTRDRGLLKRNEITHGYWIRQTGPQRQIEEVVRRFDLLASLRPFTRCLACNGTLAAAAKADVQDLVPERAWTLHNEFLRCESCARVYWPGSHHRRMMEMISRLRS